MNLKEEFFMKKIITFSLFFLICISLKGMQNGPYNEKNHLGQTTLHRAVILLPGELSNPDLHDGRIATWAAHWILKGCSIAITDNTKKTPFDYVEQYKDKLPMAYKVMLAGKIKQELEQKKQLANVKATQAEEDTLSDATQLLVNYATFLQIKFKD